MENFTTFAPTNSNHESFMDFDKAFKRYGTSQKEMAEKMGIAQPSLSRSIRNGDIKIKQLQQMAEICGVSLGEFVGASIPQEITVVINKESHIYQLKK